MPHVHHRSRRLEALRQGLDDAAVEVARIGVAADHPARVHAQRAGGRQLVRRIAGQEYVSLAVTPGDHPAPDPNTVADPVHLKIVTDGAPEKGVAIDVLGIEALRRVEGDRGDRRL